MRHCWGQKGDKTASLLLDTHFRGRTLVVRPAGELTCRTYERLRDGLIKCTAEEPAAIVVDLASLRAAIASLLTVFATVHDRIRDWPGVPLVLAAARRPLRTLLDACAVPRFVPTYHTVSEALESLGAAPGRRRREVELPCDPASARTARQLTEETCHEWGIPGMAADAVVIASELTDNMVYHARSDGRLRLDLRGNMLTVAVADADPHPPRLRVPGLGADGGRGLVLVNKLSRTWGTASQGNGKVVWAVLTVPSRTRTRAHPGYAWPATAPSAAAARYSPTS
ncbi:MAG: STAS domain-containing protein [Actinomycetota bacterium]|nr:STAS domain-containing protein [Actinomycetota bacterium]